ncbi:hypothetical protein RM844_31210 [Streptomyces sp. DSM 44915]|uniref:Uncharacterized protein n=1 Tax=Streptomyces chisholmiae TaxID=3075540 RepID=A0ABU2K0I7_9ACTN|nr:hypothetical protein [Streptomyces sp. DSM 44915]MDT0270749.1 hypothetical protein [Streptomyces sp. DSM 44915]
MFSSCADYLDPRMAVPDGPLPVDPLSRVRSGPEPVEGCAECGERATRRDRAKSHADWPIVTDFNVLLRQHPTHGQSRSDRRRR